MHCILDKMESLLPVIYAFGEGWNRAFPVPHIALGGAFLGLVAIVFVQTRFPDAWFEWWRTDLHIDDSQRKKEDVTVDNDATEDVERMDVTEETLHDRDQNLKEEVHRRKKEKESSTTSVFELTENERNELGIDKAQEERLRDFALKTTCETREEAKREVARSLRSIIKHMRTGKSIDDLLDIPLYQRILRFILRKFDLILLVVLGTIAVVMLAINHPATVKKITGYVFPQESDLVYDFLQRLREKVM